MSILYIYIYIYIFVYLIFGDISIWWCNFFGSQAKKLDLSLSLSLILSLSLAWLINQAKPSQAKLKFFGILTSLSSNIVFRLVSNSSQVWAFDFYWWAKFKHTLLSKVWLIYGPLTNPIFGWKPSPSSILSLFFISLHSKHTRWNSINKR